MTSLSRPSCQEEGIVPEHCNDMEKPMTCGGSNDREVVSDAVPQAYVGEKNGTLQSDTEHGLTSESGNDLDVSHFECWAIALSNSVCPAHQVIWDGEDDPKKPYNWSGTRRLTMTIVLSLGGLVTLMSTSMMAPALPDIGADLVMGPSETNLALSIYILALAVGPLFISPLSEMLGRKSVYLACHGWYILWNALCPVGKVRGLLIAGRFFSGLGSSVGLAVSRLQFVPSAADTV